MKSNSMKNYFQNLNKEEVSKIKATINTTSKQLQEIYDFIPGIKDVKGDYYSKLSKIVDLMISYAKTNGLIDEEEYKTCISLKNGSYEGLQGTLGDITMIINEKDFMQAEQFETLDPYNPLHTDIVNTLNEQLSSIFVGDPDSENLEELVKDQK
ncbi:MAG: hypothetical protein WC376_04205 [Candidatus Nanoarchaeia archaeon]|jgi:hypothetical protein